MFSGNFVDAFADSVSVCVNDGDVAVFAFDAPELVYIGRKFPAAGIPLEPRLQIIDGPITGFEPGRDFTRDKLGGLVRAHPQALIRSDPVQSDGNQAG